MFTAAVKTGVFILIKTLERDAKPFSAEHVKP